MHRAMQRTAFRLAILFLAVSAAVVNTNAQPQAQIQLSPEMQQKIDQLAAAALAKSGVPSASVAIVKDGQIAYLHAYGNARLDPQTAGDAQHALQHRLGEQTIHPRDAPAPPGTRQAFARR